MKQIAKMAIVLAVAALMLGGCGRIKHNSLDVTKPISYSAVLPAEYTVVNHFEDSRRQVYLLYLFIPVSHANGVDIAADKLGAADGIANLQINTNFDILDFFVSLLTAGLVNTWDVNVSGDLVDYKP